MRAAVLLEDSTCHEHLHYAFAPEHFALVATDFHDIGPKLQALIGNRTAAEQMADAWYNRGTRAMSIDCTLDYVAAVVRQYSAIQAAPPAKRESWHVYTYETDRIDKEPREPSYHEA